MIGVRYFRNIVFALAAFLWLPLSAHCQLESIPGLEFLACPSPNASSGNPNSHCDDSDCCSAERSQYKAEQLRLTLPAPDLLPVLSTPLLTLANTLPAEVSMGILTAAPPEFPQSWQFIFRTASPPRAPSFAS